MSNAAAVARGNEAPAAGIRFPHWLSRAELDATTPTAHRGGNPIQNAPRDIDVMASHVPDDWATSRELPGTALLGLPPNSPVW